MQTATKNQSLLNDAFEILLKNLGPQKATQLWQILTPFKGNYLETRKKIFKEKKLLSIFNEAKKFNR